MLFTRRHLCILALTALSVTLSFRPASAQTQLKAADLQTDVAILRRAYETMHPGLYRYNTKPEMNHLFDDLARELNHDQSRDSAYLTISVFLAKIKCGHTYANFYNQDKAVTNDLLMRGERMPFYFRWLGDRMVITRSFATDASLPAGTEVLSINSVPVKTIQARLLTIARADGSNQGKRINYLQVQGEDKYEAFDIYYSLFFPPQSDTATLRIIRPGEKPTVVSAQTLTQADRLKQFAADTASEDDSPVPWTTRFVGDKAAVLAMRTWALFGDDAKWKGYIDSLFDQLIDKHIPNLIIDLRVNEGGVSVGNYLLTRLVEKDLPLPGFHRYVRNRTVPKDLNQYLDTWDDSFRDWGSAVLEPPIHNGDPAMDGLYRFTKFDDTKDGDVIQPQGRRYTGKVYVLVGATNSSATFEFAQMIQYSKLGTLVGQTTGGNQRGINGGAFFFLHLPKSGIEVDLPLVGQFADKPRPDRGIAPDIPVTPTVQDIANGIDPELAAVLQRIGS